MRLLRRTALAVFLLVVLVNTHDYVQHTTGYSWGWIEKLCVCGGTLHASYWLGLDAHMP